MEPHHIGGRELPGPDALVVDGGAAGAVAVEDRERAALLDQLAVVTRRGRAPPDDVGGRAPAYLHAGPREISDPGGLVDEKMQPDHGFPFPGLTTATRRSAPARGASGLPALASRGRLGLREARLLGRRRTSDQRQHQSQTNPPAVPHRTGMLCPPTRRGDPEASAPTAMPQCAGFQGE